MAIVKPRINLLTRALFLAGGVVVAACTTPATEPLRVSPADIVGGYEISGVSEPRVLQAFNDGHATYIEFARTPPATLRVQVGQAGTLAYDVRGRYIVVPGVLSDLQLVGAPGVVRVRRALRASGDTPAGTVTEQAWQPDSNADWGRDDTPPSDDIAVPPGAPVTAPRAQPLPR